MEIKPSKTIIADLDSMGNPIQYLSQIMEVLPSNVILDKTITGCGGTTLEINADRHSIIVVPFRSMLQNKAESHPDLIYIDGKVDRANTRILIEEKLDQSKKVKIMVTYDSLKKVYDAFPDDFNQLQECFLLIDEYHVTFKSYRFRNSAIRTVLRLAPLFDKVCYLSATPIKDSRFVLDEIRHLPLWKIEWKHAQRIKVKGMPAKYTNNAVCKLIKANMKGDLKGNLHFFYNSVRGIAKVLRSMQLDPSEVMIKCADTADNQSKLGRKYKITQSLKQPKKYNFYTATAFEGCDIFDPNGRTIIVSDPANDFTILDISTSIPQICGRIRDSIYKGEVMHVYHPTTNKYMQSEIDFKQQCEERKQEGIKRMKICERHDDTKSHKITVAEGLDAKIAWNYLYIAFDPDSDYILKFDPNFIATDEYYYLLINQIYSTRYNVGKEYQRNGMDYQEIAQTDNWWDTYEKLGDGKKPSFKKTYKMYRRMVEVTNKTDVVLDAIYEVELEFPLVVRAYRELSAEKVLACRYEKKRILAALTKDKDLADNLKVTHAVRYIFKRGNTYTNEKVLEILNNTYQKHRVYKKAKVVHLSYWLDVKQTKITVGKRLVQSIDKEGNVVSEEQLKRVNGVKILGVNFDEITVCSTRVEIIDTGLLLGAS